MSFAEGFASQIDRSARMAEDELDAVIAADAVLVVASQHDGRGMFVELGVALARACRGDLDHIVLIGEIHHESVFYSTRVCSGCPPSRTGSLNSTEPIGGMVGRPVLNAA